MSLKAPVDQYIKIKGINTRFWSMGDEGASVILIHGIGCYIEMWENNIEALSHNHRVYAIDLAGFGRSDKPTAQYSFPFLTHFVLDFMDMLNIKRASLVGNSMGGGISLQIAIQFPDIVDKLILVDSAGLGKDVSIVLRLASIPLIGELLTRPSRKGTYRFMKECVYDPSILTNDVIELGYRITSLPNAQKAFLKTLRSSCEFGGMNKMVLGTFLEHLHKITAPTLVVWGQQDKIIPVDLAHVAEKRIPNAKLHIFDPCGHFPQIERSEEFNNLVLDFLKGKGAVA